jgi:predicted house-cleaning noncanonical NTP pyrophosphatase (MazG superfamily)
MKRFLLDKLGRDKAEELFKDQGCKLKYHIVEENDEFLDALTQKMVEELEEVFSCETKEQVIEELADLEEVMAAFKKLIDVDQKDIDAVKKAKFEKKGGFEKRVYVEYVDVPEGTEQYNYFMTDPEKYPEIVDEIKADDTK